MTANTLFQDICRVPQYAATTKKPKGIWEAVELDLEPEKNKKQGSKRNPKPASKTKPNLGKVTPPPRPSQLNDTVSEQSAQEACLLGTHVESGDTPHLDLWHSAQTQTSGNLATGNQQGKTASHPAQKPEVIQEPQPTDSALIMAEAQNDTRQHELVGAPDTAADNNQQPPVRFTPTEARNIERIGKDRYHYPRVFVLLTQIAYLTELRTRRLKQVFSLADIKAARDDNPTLAQVPTEQLVGKAKENSIDVRRALYRNLQLAHEYGLISQQERVKRGNTIPTSYWELTSEGKRFLMEGIRTRNAMQKISNHYSDEEICAQISADEMEDWRIDAEYRAHQLHNFAGLKRPPTLEVSRSALVRALEMNARQKIQTSAVNNMWCGLLQR